jgi:site-specific recombinase XerD
VRPRGRDSYKPNTVRSYRRALTNHIDSSGVGKIKVTDVRRADVQALADELLAEGLAAGTVSNVLNPIQALYRRLIDRDLTAYNPATRIDLPTLGNVRPSRIVSGADAPEWSLSCGTVDVRYGLPPSTLGCDEASCRLSGSAT